ncbi:dynein light chain Tctex-type protein 2B isoform X1 [Anguilla rostrata]|uniref:dynein light chain Tctex-type protein 2B isoform X1 n=1 Tax=Anguilla rostrata TaxID=7938 RepID=UPI0030D05994
MEEPDTLEHTYIIRPNYQHKFKVGVVKECIREVLKEQLGGTSYNPQLISTQCRSVADCIKDKLKDLGFDRYKLVVQVVIGEQRGEGVKMAARCFWDADTDGHAQDMFMNPVLCGCCIWLLLLLSTERAAFSQRRSATGHVCCRMRIIHRQQRSTARRI